MRYRSLKGTIGGILGSITTTYVSILGGYYTVFLPMGPTLSFAIGSLAGAAIELSMARGVDYLSTTEGIVVLSTATVVGGLIGGFAGGRVTSLAGDIGRKILQSGVIKERFISAILGADMRNVGRAALYWAREPAVLFRIISKYLRPDMIWGIKDSIGTTFLSGGSQALTAGALEHFVEPVLEVFHSFKELCDSYNEGRTGE